MVPAFFSVEVNHGLEAEDDGEKLYSSGLKIAEISFFLATGEPRPETVLIECD